MPIARKHIIDSDQVGIYHCYSRCVRRAFLCGRDPYTGKSYDHRRGWIARRVKTLASSFAVEVFSYAVMPNHTHVIVRSRPDLASDWTPIDVARRWLTLFPGQRPLQEGVAPLDPRNLEAFARNHAKIKECRLRLANISWLMRCLNEPIARRANREDKCTGRFWEGRFRCQRLADEGALLACMAYVDLNPVRARLAEGLADSHFTSVYDRLEARLGQRRAGALQADEENPGRGPSLLRRELERGRRADWLVSLEDEGGKLGSLGTEGYMKLLEWTGRASRADKPGHLPMGVRSILEEMDLAVEKWAENVSGFGGLFCGIAGRVEDLVERARKTGRCWFRGRRGAAKLYHAASRAT